MDTSQQKLFDIAPIETYQYLLIISPPDRIKKKVAQLKHDFANKYKIDSEVKSLVQITVGTFVGQEIHQTRLVKRIKDFTEKTAEVKMKLTAIDGFTSGTIYVKVEKEGLAIKHFIKRVAAHFEKTFTPHITIVKDLDKEIFQKSLADFSKLPFDDSFIADSFILLRRKTIKDTYKQVAEFKFEGKGAAPMQ